ncbi:hypothetical protein E3E35_01500 [Thermococcus sp. GR7]|uniref:hypothetical protein n=1 Tax=unclassified Thermococcus TaxID=2627626 RepID=UPI0014319744|nr:MULTISPECIES: hypothetical protein [unclassified Thermococcus]NJE46105.1 hypothetical protein [Thermococcus sp. GR7]NJE78259.1 hypothetical protein [Thermococcus sp. GR4]NJF22302.1 hypothetical protein [Thermococcus sp. GR5]
MKRLAVSLFILLLASSLVSAATYTLPGDTYNNIGILGQVMIDLNVTIVNTASFPKFIVVNPRYDFTVYRLDNSEAMKAFFLGDSVIHNLSNIQRTTLNYYTGFWIMPYETVVVNFRITSHYSYIVPTVNYQTVCGDQAKITSVEYNGSQVSGVIGDLDDISVISCGVIYPQLINTPKVVYLKSMFPIVDGHIKILKYDGTVTFRLTNVPNEGGLFNTFFAASIPVIFDGAKTYDFVPNYTMTYKEYMEDFVWRYKGLTSPQKTPQPQPAPSLPGMFQLSNTLISGISVGTPEITPPQQAGFDFPVWIIFMGRSVDITYHVSWTKEGR